MTKPPVLIEGRMPVTAELAAELARDGLITMPPPVIVATLDDAAVTALYAEAEQHAATLLRQHAIEKLATAILLEVKKDGPTPPPTTADQARAVLQTLSLRLEEASQALFLAADRLKKHGDALGASRTYAAAQQTQIAAHALD